MSQLEGKIEEIISDIIDGCTYRTIAAKYNTSLGVLHRFLCKAEHSARVREAMELSAASYADKAEETLIQAEATKEELMRARELAQHYRWKAAKRNPKAFGDKIEQTHVGDPEKPIQQKHEVVFVDMTKR